MSTPVFAELTARSHYSFLEGSSSPEALVATAVDLGLGGLGLCDRNGLYGVVSFVQAARRAGIHPVVGAELDLADGQHIRLLARDREGYRQLSRAISAAQLAGEKGQPRLVLDSGTAPACAAAAPLARPLDGAAPTTDPAPPTDHERLAVVTGSAASHPAPTSRRRPTPPPPQRPAALRPTAGPFPHGWPGLPSTRPLATGEPAHIDPAGLDHCIALVGGPESAITRALIAGDRRVAERDAARLGEAFGRDSTALLLTHHLHPADSWLVEETARLARRCGLATVASNTPVHARVDDKPLLDTLTAIRQRTTLDRAAAHGLLLPNAEHRLKSEAELRTLLAAHPEAFDNAAYLAARCSLSLDFSDVRFPGFPVPQGETPFSFLYRLCQEAVQRKYSPVTPTVAARLQRELDVIQRTGLAEFFLITWDIMRYARDNGIPGQGRGSAADSIVAYLLDVTRVDPVAHDLLFERFLHEDHTGTPDIDIDFSTDHREQILQYVYAKYGAERTGMVANVVTFRPRIAVRQVGAALDFPEPIIDRLAKSLDSWYAGSVDDAIQAAGLQPTVQQEAAAGRAVARRPPARFIAPSGARLAWPEGQAGLGAAAPQSARIAPSQTDRRQQASASGAYCAGTDRPAAGRSLPWTQFVDLLDRISGAPRHLSIHVGGMLVTGAPLVDVAPVERATMPGRVVVQFNKDDVEDLGLIKMDLLGLRTLSAVAECLDLVAATTGTRPDLDAIPLDDPAVYDMICDIDTIGLFQIESRAQQQSLHQSQPREFNELVVQVAIIRPGPIQGNAVHPYLRRRQGLEPVTYLHPTLEPILSDTRGVVLYQEQILRIVMEVAGYTAGEADRFRRAMNRHRSRLEMQSLHDEFVTRCTARDIPAAVAEEIFVNVAGFAQFGFCKSHAAAFARTAYETGWLRLRHPAAWLCALLNAQPMGFYHPSVLVEDGKRHGVRTLPVDITRSRARSTLEWVGEGPPPAPAVRAGLAPGWRLDAAAGDTPRVIPDPLTHRAPTPGERAAAAAVTAARPATGWPESPWAVRLGFGYVRALGPEARAACDEAVGAGVTGSVAEFWRRTCLPRPAMENLVLVGAFDAVAPDRPRRALLWELREAEDVLPPRRRRGGGTGVPTLLAGTRARLEVPGAPAPTPPPARTGDGPAPAGPPRGRAAVAGDRPGDARRSPRHPDADPLPPLLVAPAPAPPLPPMGERDRTAAEYRVSELSTGPHLVAFLRPRLDALRCTPMREARARPNGSSLRVGGLVIARQAPASANGFRFFTLADEGGHLDLIFRPAVVRATRSVATFHQLLVVDGTLQSDSGRLNLMVSGVSAIDAEGRIIETARAAYGGGAAPDAPRSQHGHTAPARRRGDGSTRSGWDTPASHDFR